MSAKNITARAGIINPFFPDLLGQTLLTIQLGKDASRSGTMARSGSSTMHRRRLLEFKPHGGRVAFVL